MNLIYAPEPGDDFEDAKDIRMLHVTYDDQHIIDVDFAIDQYNEDKKRTGGQTVNRVASEDRPLALADFIGINLVLYEIGWEPANGNATLGRLIGEAAAGFILPPFIAVTDEVKYHNTNLEQTQYAKDHHFLGGYKQIATAEELQFVLDYCERMLGQNWLATRVGRILPPSSLPSATLPSAIFLVVPEITDVNSMGSSFAGSTMPSPRPETSYGGSKDLNQDALPPGMRTAQAAASCTQSPTVQRKPTSCWSLLCCCFSPRIVPDGHGMLTMAW